ncbi:hypothetical protein AG1IA_10412 [Rhizoctonia solani AG-1 IA]|uniref:Uncharacterized protein n=1 Tax=Thanatephorus cucumeris (strain AG1-IA) TaxID=983506 RepID=L8WFJ8_THACA|nr:hypothetical protein AG1IA_10412 [Rhizoctonia solani AG-1 IA]
MRSRHFLNHHYWTHTLDVAPPTDKSRFLSLDEQCSDYDFSRGIHQSRRQQPHHLLISKHYPSVLFNIQ